MQHDNEDSLLGCTFRFLPTKSSSQQQKWWMVPLGYYGYYEHGKAVSGQVDYEDSDYYWTPKRDIHKTNYCRKSNITIF